MTTTDTRASSLASAEFMQKDHDHADQIIYRIHHAIRSIENRELDSTLLRELLQSLIDHKKSHFSREDKLMDIAECTEATRHRQEHSKLIQELTAVLDHWKKYQDTYALQMYFKEILPLWFDNHLDLYDYPLLEKARVTPATDKPIVRRIK